jgi:hypothetical protein
MSLMPAPAEGPKPDIDQCMMALRTKFRKGELFQLLDDGFACIRVADLKVDTSKRLAAVLFQYADKRVADPVFSDLVSGTLRQETKLNGEGVAISAHALISLTPTQSGGIEFQLLLEDVPGIGKTKIERFLKTFLKLLLSTTFKDRSSKKDLVTYPTVTLSAYASKTLREDLEAGELRFVELTRDLPIKELDELPETAKVVHSIKIKAKNKPQGQHAIGFINSIKTYGNIHRYDDVKVVFKRANNQQKTVNFKSLREDAGDICFGKVEEVTVTHALAQCVSDIDAILLRKMKALLRSSL